MKNLIKFEFKSNLKNLFVWTFVIFLIMLCFMALFPSLGLSEFNEVLNKELELMPEAVKAMLGIRNFLNFSEIMTYFGYCFQFVFVALGIYAITLGSRMVAKEQDKKTIDYLITKPINRRDILLSKYIVGIIIIITFTVINLICNTLLVGAFNSFDFSVIDILAKLHIAVLFTLIIFYSVAFLLSSIFDNTFKANMIGVAIFFISYFLGTMSVLLDKVDFLKVFSPLQMFNMMDIATKYSDINYIYCMSLIVVSVILLGVSVKIFNKKDLIS